MAEQVYLDYAAATPLDGRVLAAMKPYWHERFANPESPHSLGRQQLERLEAARHALARQLGAKPTEIILTGGSTESANLALQGIMRGFPRGRLVMSAIEHPAVGATATALERQGHSVGVLPVDHDGLVAPEQLAAAVDDMTVLVAVQYANHEVGAIQPIAKLAAAVAQIRADRQARGITFPLYLFCDAAQAGPLNLQVSRLGVDLLSLGGSKLYGPAGSGLLYARTGVPLEPLLFGGGQERGRRSGTPDVGAAVGLARALELMQADRATESRRQRQLRDWLWRELSTRVMGLTLNGSLTPRLPGNLNFQVEGADAETLVSHLDAAGFAVATGSACTAAGDDPSEVLLALGLSVPQAQSSLRVTLGRPTTKHQLQRFGAAMVKVVPRVRELSGDTPARGKR